METAEVQQKAAALSSQFETLAQDFRGIDPAGGYRRVIDLAGYGAKLCKKAYDAGLLDLSRYKRQVALLAERASKNTCQQDDLQSLIRDLLLEEYGEIPDQPLDALDELLDQRLDERKMWPSTASADMWAGTWRAIVSDLCRDHPDELPCNTFVTTNSYDWHFRERFRWEAPRNAKTEWRSLAQNYAMVADWLAEHLQAGGPPRGAQRAKKSKRSTERGEGRAKLIGALVKHHKYADGSCLNLEYIGNNELARLAQVSESTASTFFSKEFEGHTKYRALCRDASQLVAALKLLNQDFSPHHLFGRCPPGEDERGDEE